MTSTRSRSFSPAPITGGDFTKMAHGPDFALPTSFVSPSQDHRSRAQRDAPGPGDLRRDGATPAQRARRARGRGTFAALARGPGRAADVAATAATSGPV